MDSYKLIDKNSSTKNHLRVVGEKKWKEDYEHSDVVEKVNFQKNLTVEELQRQFTNSLLKDRELAKNLELLAEAIKSVQRKDPC